MAMLKRTLTVTGLAIGLSLPAHAAIINNGSYATDTATGLNWRNLSLGAGLSYDQTLGDLSGSLSGWQIATAAQVVQLLMDGGFPTGVYTGASPMYTASAFSLFSAIGQTITPYNAISQFVGGFEAYFAPTASEAQYNEIPVADVLLDGSNDVTIAPPGWGNTTASFSSVFIAPFLVSDSAGSTPVATPEPATLSLLGTAMLGVAGWRRRNRKPISV